jgi:hypothetical protein
MQAMEPVEEDLYQAVLYLEGPAGSVECYVAALDENGAAGGLGTAASPVRLRAEERERSGSVAAALWTAWGMMAGSVVLAWGAVRLRRRRKRGACRDDLAFWIRTLTPLLAMPGGEVTRQLSRLSSAPLAHPHLGTLRWDRPFLVEKLQEVRSLRHKARRSRELQRFDAPARKKRPAAGPRPVPAPGPSRPATSPLPRPNRQELPPWVAEEMASLLGTIARQEGPGDPSK